jgi:hypothetical protein
MGILLRFSVLFAMGMFGLHNAEEMGLPEACKMETPFQSDDDMGLFLPLDYCTIVLYVMSKQENDSFQLSRSRISF